MHYAIEIDGFSVVLSEPLINILPAEKYSRTRWVKVWDVRK